jgi:hypothetical protein
MSSEGFRMRISAEGKIGIALGLVGLAGAGAIMVEPTEMWIGWTLVGIATVGGLALTAYMWSERPEVLPRLLCTFDMQDIGGSVCPDTILTATRIAPGPQVYSQLRTIQSTARGTYYRVEVCANGGSLSQCKGRLNSLKFGSTRLIAETVPLPFSPAHSNDAMEKTVHVGSPEYLDFLFITDENKVNLTPPDFLGPSAVNWCSLFDAYGDYTFDIGVLSPKAQSNITLLLHWTGKRETSKIVGFAAAPNLHGRKRLCGPDGSSSAWAGLLG